MRVAVSILTLFALGCTLAAQSSAPVVIQAATPAVKSIAAPAAAAPENSGSLQSALKMLQAIKAANEETLQKQQAMLQQLDELEKAADQIKVFTKRG